MVGAGLEAQCAGTYRLMPAFQAQKTQKGWEPGSFFQPHANEFPTRNVNSRQQRLRHAVIMVDSISEAWVPPPNFLLFCLRIRKGNPVDSIQLQPALGAPTPLLSRQTGGQQGRGRVMLRRGLKPGSGSTLLSAELQAVPLPFP